METRERIVNLISDKLGVDNFEVKDEQSIINDLGADSLDMVEIIMGIEEEFGIKVKDEDINEIKTVGDLVKKIEDIRLGR